MANHASAEKRNRQRIERTNRNRAVKSAVRTAVKKARVAIAGGDTTKAADPVKAASLALARAASKGIIPTRSASRVTARIEAALAKAGRPAS
jgi:small subunit ribosomal protein S20